MYIHTYVYTNFVLVPISQFVHMYVLAVNVRKRRKVRVCNNCVKVAILECKTSENVILFLFWLKDTLPHTTKRDRISLHKLFIFSGQREKTQI